MLDEIRKGIIWGLLLISFYGVGAYIYKNQVKNKSEAKIAIKNTQDDAKKLDDTNNENIDNTKNSKDKKRKKVNGYEYKDGYVYKWSENEKSTFSKRSLGYEKRFSKTASPEELENGLKKEYCNAIKEIKKVDQNIIPGTDIPFKKATYEQADAAYKEYLQKIAQIRQVVRSVISNDKEAFEYHIKCRYKGTYWNNNNSKYLLKDFYSKEVNDYYK